MENDSTITERLLRPAELKTDDSRDSVDSDTSPELAIMPTLELKRLLAPEEGAAESANDSEIQVEDDGETEQGFDPYNRA